MSQDTDQKGAGRRKGIGLVTTEPKSIKSEPKELTPQQQALRTAVITEFRSKKIKSFVAKQVKHINANRQVADGIRFLFDEKGLPPPNAPLEDIISERKKIESEIRWFEAMANEMRGRLVQIKEIEELALEMVNKDPDAE